MSFMMIYVTHPNEECAKRISDSLIEEKLIACANILPIKSCYWWQGKIEKDDEIVTILKSDPEHWGLLKSRIKELHPYDVPCIIYWEVEANEEYEDWVRGCLRPN